MNTLPDESANPRVAVIFGTRPEAIKLAPVIRSLKARREVDVTVISTLQQADLLPVFLSEFGIEADYNLSTMVRGQSLSALLASLLSAIDSALEKVSPALVIVQGDTSSTLAGAMAGSNRKIPVLHVEAGLRTKNPANPFPEELNRRQISALASIHCAATTSNRTTLLSEGIDADTVFVTGNPVVDAVLSLGSCSEGSDTSLALQQKTAGYKVIVLTTHRRENFGSYMERSLQILHDFVVANSQFVLVFPVHPNPAVREAVGSALGVHPRIFLIDPLGYEDFIDLCRSAWLLVSDSGGIQEEAATLGTRLLILRSLTERPEAVDCGVARLIGPNPDQLRNELTLAMSGEGWIQQAAQAVNPFGNGSSGRVIADLVCDKLLVDGRV